MGMYRDDFKFNEETSIDLHSIANQVQQRSGLEMKIDIDEKNINFFSNNINIGDCFLEKIDQHSLSLSTFVVMHPKSLYLSGIIFGVLKDVGAVGIEEKDCIREPWVIFDKKKDGIVFRLVRGFLKLCKVIK
jgi:hypothetical protein